MGFLKGVMSQKIIYLDELKSITDDVYKNNYVGYKCLKINNDSIILNKKDSVIEIIITKRINNGYGGSDEVKMTFLRKLWDSLCFNDDQFNDVLKNFTNTKFPPEDDNAVKVATIDTNKQKQLEELIEPSYLNYISRHLNTMDRNLLTYHLIINLKKISNENIKTIKDIMNYEPETSLFLLASTLVGYEVNGGVLLLTFETVKGLRYIVLNTNDDDFKKQLSNYVIKKDEIIKYTEEKNKVRSQMNSDVNSAGTKNPKSTGAPKAHKKKTLKRNKGYGKIVQQTANKAIAKTGAASTKQINPMIAGAQYHQYCYKS